MQLTNAANVAIPAIKLLRDLGYTIRLARPHGLFTAEKDGNRFSSDDPVAVLGLVRLYEARGEDWGIEDAALQDIGREFGLL